MKRTGIILLNFGILFAVLIGSNDAGNGCVWSGCKQFGGKKCNTGLTGDSGRSKHIASESCDPFGRKDYCCADDCRVINYSENCSGQRFQIYEGYYLHRIDVCCGGGSVISIPNPYGRNAENVQTRNTNIGGFRSTPTVSEGVTDGDTVGDSAPTNRVSSNGGGFRSGSSSGGFRNSNTS